ncbi:MAG TPA: tRNA (guanosine(37)-N1)-methyltransferase TrmD [Ruminococcaceae bacterium]|nr:tRNA (guanosine(37)-N1)-methyltransferase TrmD [Oscillospiraceae bacterium]
MRIDLLTLFPDMCRTVLTESITGRALAKGLFELEIHNFRDYTTDKHNRVDDEPYGGGMGMLLTAQPIYDCIAAVKKLRDEPAHVIYMSPQGKTLTQKRVTELSKLPRLIILCGHYEGVDERVLEETVDEEISMGDYVLTGGELPSLALCDAVLRLVPGVLSSEECFLSESHMNGLLEYPHYTRPAEWMGRRVPEVLLSGHHAMIEKWRREQSVLRTARKRPELLESAELSFTEKIIAGKEKNLSEE